MGSRGRFRDRSWQTAATDEYDERRDFGRFPKVRRLRGVRAGSAAHNAVGLAGESPVLGIDWGGFAGSEPRAASRGQSRYPVFVTHGNPGSVRHPCAKRRNDSVLRERMNRHRIAPTGRRSARDRLPQLGFDAPREMGDVVRRNRHCIARADRQQSVGRQDSIPVQRIRARRWQPGTPRRDPQFGWASRGQVR